MSHQRSAPDISGVRKEKGLSQKQLAELVEREEGGSISPQYLNDIEHDRRNPPSDHMIPAVRHHSESQRQLSLLPRRSHTGCAARRQHAAAAGRRPGRHGLPADEPAQAKGLTRALRQRHHRPLCATPPHYEPAELDKECERILVGVLWQAHPAADRDRPLGSARSIERDTSDFDPGSDLSRYGLDVEGVTEFQDRAANRACASSRNSPMTKCGRTATGRRSPTSGGMCIFMPISSTPER